MSNVIPFPTGNLQSVADFQNPIARWEAGAPGRKGADPRTGEPCQDCGRTFAWDGYDGLCGWCREAGGPR